jgi:hypothetical protein
MGIARHFGAVAVVVALAAAGAARAQPLAETPAAGDCYRVRLTMQLKGEMVVVQEGKPTSLKLAASAEHRYRERVLAVAPQGGTAVKAARYYDDARATITVDNAPAARSLRADRRLVVAQRHEDQLACYCPHGPLTRQELETVSEHFDTLSVGGLLPGKDVKPGDTWKVGNPAAQAICLFHGLVANDLTGKLAEVKGGVAAFTIEGTARGIELGAQAKVTVSATGRFDLAKRRVVALEWKQQDARDQGPASPAVNVETTVTLEREPIDQPHELSDVALVSVPQGFDVPPPLTQLVVRDLKDRYELAAGREWQVVSQTESHLVLRMLERGDFVAQATVSPWQKAEPGQHADVKEFRDAMMASPGWEPEEVLQEGELPGQPNGRFVYRLTARGSMEDVKIVQTFYLVTGPKGDQCVVVFTLKQAQLAKLGARDQVLVDGIGFPAK